MKRILVLAIVIAGCSKVIDNDKLEPVIKSGLESHGLPLAKLDCPHGKPAKKGANFTCTATTTDGQALTIDITQNDDDGNVNWLLRGNLFDVREIKDVLAKDGFTDAKCPHAVNVMTENQKITCDVQAKGAPAKLEFHFENDKLKWKPL